MRVGLRRTAAAITLAACLASGCTTGGAADEPISVPSLGPVAVDADTPELRRLKERAGIETCLPARAPSAAAGLPAITLPCLGGGPDVDLARLRGPLIVNIWGSWCGPCEKELPILADFHRRHGGAVAMLGLDFQDTQPQAALELAERSGVTYPQVFDHDGAVVRSTLMPGAAVPALAFVDADGRVTGWVPGQITSLEQLLTLVERHLGLDL